MHSTTIASFAEILSPYLEKDFFDSVWEKKHLLIERNDPKFYDALFELPSFERIVGSAAVKPSDMLLFRSGVPVSESEYVLRSSTDPVALRNLVGTGASVIVNGIEGYSESIERFCRILDKTFAHPFQTNAYFTPASSQALKIHFDDHDVFVLQISGSKLWRLYGRPIVNPMPGQHYDVDLDAVGQPSVEVTLKAGDLLYIPRGLLHDARSTLEASLHLTVGAVVYTWAELILESVAEVILRDERLRAALPRGLLDSRLSIGNTRKTFEILVDLLRSESDFDASLELLRERFVLSRRPPHGRLSEERQLSPETVVQIKPEVLFLCTRDVDDMTVMAHGREIHFPSEFSACVEALLHTASATRIADIVGGQQSEILEVAQALLRQGLLERLS